MHGAEKRRTHRNEACESHATLRGSVIQAQVGLRLKSERVMNEWRRDFTLPRRGEGQSCNVSSDALPPAAVVLTVKVRSVAKRNR